MMMNLCGLTRKKRKLLTRKRLEPVDDFYRQPVEEPKSIVNVIEKHHKPAGYRD